MNQLSFTTDLRQHLLIGFLKGMWVYLFLVIIGPFDTYELEFWWRAELMLGYWLIFTVAYWLVIPVQNGLFRWLRRWTWQEELLIAGLVFAFAFVPIYTFYKSDHIEGEFPFPIFTLQVYLPASLILLPMMIAVRRFIMRKELVASSSLKVPDKITLRGTYQKDILHINWTDLVCIKSAGNYVEVHFLQAELLQKKLLRTSTQKIEEDFPNLLRTHRSYLINPDHFVAWKGRKQLLIAKLEIPVSENYRNAIEAHFMIRP